MKIVLGAFAATFLAGVTVVPTAPALAQNQRIIEVFGNDPCPTSNGEEIVVCNRRPEPERYRIPERLRTTEQEKGARNTGVALADSVRSASRDGLPDHCSSSGASGHTGCFKAFADQARAEKKAAKADVPVIDN